MTPPKKFGNNWKSMLANEDDWADECRSSQTAFATTERGHDTVSGTIDTEA